MELNSHSWRKMSQKQLLFHHFHFPAPAPEDFGSQGANQPLFIFNSLFFRKKTHTRLFAAMAFVSPSLCLFTPRVFY